MHHIVFYLNAYAVIFVYIKLERAIALKVVVCNIYIGKGRI